MSDARRRQAVRQGAQEAPQAEGEVMGETATPKDGVRTSEFWVFRVIEILQIIGGVAGLIPWDLVAGLVAGSGVAYGGLRTLAKR